MSITASGATGICPNGTHAFAYAGQPLNDRIPEGWPCCCGQTVARWKKCEYGGEHLVAEPTNGEHHLKEYHVSVTRVGYSYADLTVNALHEKDAADKAVKAAGNYIFSEVSADYEVGAIREARPVLQPR